VPLFYPIVFYRVLPVMLLVWLGSPFTLAADVKQESSLVTLPFSIGERLTYDLSWTYVKAGTAVMAVEDSAPINGRPTIKLRTIARSSPTITKFYPVLNQVESFIDTERFLPLRMIFSRREGKRKNDFEYTFRHEAGSVTATKDGKVEELTLPADAQDAVSCLYFARKSLPLAPGSALILNVHHDKKNYKLEVRVEGLETIEGPWGKAQTARVLVIMPFQGIFLNEGNIRVWLTTDPHHVPVRMKAKVVIGSIVAELVNGFHTPDGRK
jgi:hypothetical protein